MRDSQRCAMAEGTLVANLVCDCCVFLAFFGTLQSTIHPIHTRSGRAKDDKVQLGGLFRAWAEGRCAQNCADVQCFLFYYGRYYLRPCSISSPMLPVTYLNSALLPAAAV